MMVFSCGSSTVKHWPSHSAHMQNPPGIYRILFFSVWSSTILLRTIRPYVRSGRIEKLILFRVFTDFIPTKNLTSHWFKLVIDSNIKEIDSFPPTGLKATSCFCSIKECPERNWKTYLLWNIFPSMWFFIEV